MRTPFLIGVCAAAVLLAGTAAAQRPDSTRRPVVRSDSAAKRDSAARADSAAADSIALVRELERQLQAEPQRPAGAQAPASPGGAQGPINPRLLPDLSAVGDLIGDLSPDHSTQEDGRRFGVREVEIAVQAAVDPFFRGDVFLGLSDLEGIAIEQAYLTATALPWHLEVRLGRFLTPFGKQNLTHRHDLHTIEYPWVIQRFFGPEGLKGTGVWASRVFAPFGFYQELQLTAVDQFREDPEGLTPPEPPNRKLSGLGYSARFRNYWDLNEASNLELSASAITGRRPQPVSGPVGEVNAVNARQSVVGADFTYRWRPLQQGLYKSFILQVELMRQLNERDPAIPDDVVQAEPPPCPGCDIVPPYAGPTRDFSGAYAFARYQLTRRLYLGGRYDWLQDPDADGERFMAGSGYLEFFPSEFSKLMVGFERLMPSSAYRALVPDANDARSRILLQASFALGPHRPHPF